MNFADLETRIVLLMTMGVAGYSFVALARVQEAPTEFQSVIAPAFGFLMLLFAVRTVIEQYRGVRGEGA